MHYVTTWFAVDAATVFIPCTFDLYQASGALDHGDASNVGRMTILRVLRVLRLFKLVRLVRASRLYQRWKAKITISYGTQTMLQAVVTLIMSCHWFACIIGLSTSLHSSTQETWMGAHMFNLCGEEKNNLWVVSDPTGGGVEVEHALQVAVSNHSFLAVSLEDCDIGVGDFYLASFSWSAMVLTGTGGTDYHPSYASSSETFLVMLLTLSGAFIWTMVLAAFCDVATNGDPAMTTFRQQIDGLNAFIAFNNVPGDMARRMRLYMQQQKGLQLRRDWAAKSLPSLSLPLQLEAVLFIHRNWLNGVWFVRDLEAPVKVRLAMSMGTKVMAPGEVAPNRHLYVLSRGSIIFGGRVLGKGAAWGDDVILHAAHNCLPYLARAITYSDVSKLHRDTLFEIVRLYPVSTKQLRRATMFLATRRFIIALARQIRDAAAKDGGASLLHSPGRARWFGADFVDRINEAAQDVLTQSQEKSIELALELTKQRQRDMPSTTTAGDTGKDDIPLTPVTSACSTSEGGVTASLARDLMSSLNEIKGSIRQLQADVKRLEQRQDQGADEQGEVTRVVQM